MTNIQPIIDSLQLPDVKVTSISGGDINDAYCLHSGADKYFLKLNDAERYPDMLKMEAIGLNKLRGASSLIIPEVVQTGTIAEQQYLLLTWIENGAPCANFWKNFGYALAGLHRQPQPFFGLEEDNYIGNLPQKNTHRNSWGEFYAQCRILPLNIQLKEAGIFSMKDIQAAENFCKKIDEIFPTELPSLLHGDLWSGNYMSTQNGTAAIFDPAIYYGHREMDIGMTLLFGGFAQPFYTHYCEAYPLERNWRQRVPFSQLYPILVHAVLFGGHYIYNVREILKKF